MRTQAAPTGKPTRSLHELGEERLVPVGHPELFAWHIARYRLARREAGGNRVLDVGCGEGYGPALLAEVAADVVAVDYSPAAVAHARRTYVRDNLRFRVADANELQSLGTFDLITCFEVVEHLENQEEFVASAAAMLAPGGKLILSTPNVLVDRPFEALLGTHFDYHISLLSPRELRALLERHFGDVALYGQSVRGNRAHGLLKRCDAFNLRHRLVRSVALQRAIASSVMGKATVPKPESFCFSPRLVRQSPIVVAVAANPTRRLGTKHRVVLVAHDVHDGGGMERACAELVRRALPETDFTVVSRTLADDLQGLVDWRRIRTPARPFLLKYLTFFVLGGLRLRSLRGIRHSIGAIVPNRVDVAGVHFCHAGYAAATRLVASPELPLLRQLHTTLCRAVSLWAERWCYRPGRVRGLAAVSSDLARELVAHYPGVPCIVTPNGVDADRFRPDDAVRARLRPALGAGPDDVVALFVGGDWDRKGLGIAVAATAEAARAGASVRLWVAGCGDERRFRALAERHGAGDRVTFLGFRTDTERLCQAADVFVLPSLYEAHPLAPYEAACCRLPVVVAPVNGVAELVGEDEAGFVVERTPAATAAALVRLARDPALRKRQSLRARERACAFGWERSIEGLLRLYGKLTIGEMRA